MSQSIGGKALGSDLIAKTIRDFLGTEAFVTMPMNKSGYSAFQKVSPSCRERTHNYTKCLAPHLLQHCWEECKQHCREWVTEFFTSLIQNRNVIWIQAVHGERLVPEVAWRLATVMPYKRIDPRQNQFPIDLPKAEAKSEAKEVKIWLAENVPKICAKLVSDPPVQLYSSEKAFHFNEPAPLLLLWKQKRLITFRMKNRATKYRMQGIIHPQPYGLPGLTLFIGL